MQVSNQARRLGQRALLAGGGSAALALFASSQTQPCKTEARRGLQTVPLAKPVTLYQYASCPFCNKAQAFMEYCDVPYVKVEVNPLSKKEIKFSEYKMVPFAIISYENQPQEQQINGSAQIINALLGPTYKQTQDEKKWFEWVDQHLVHLLPPNIYRTPNEALESFNYITNTSGNFSAAEKIMIRYLGAAAMFFVAKKAIKKYNLTDDVRKDLEDALIHWTRQGLQGRQFHGGKQMDTADLAVYGVLRSIDGNYTTWNDILQRQLDGEKDTFWKWYNSCKDAVNQKNKN